MHEQVIHVMVSKYSQSFALMSFYSLVCVFIRRHLGFFRVTLQLYQQSDSGMSVLVLRFSVKNDCQIC